MIYMTTTNDITETTTTTGRPVRIKVAATGLNFGYVGFVRALNNRTIAETDVYPTRQSARAAAMRLAESL